MTAPSDDSMKTLIIRTAAGVRLDGRRLLDYANWLEAIAANPDTTSGVLAEIGRQLQGVAGALSALASQLPQEDER